MVNTPCLGICGEVLQLCVISTSIPQLENCVYCKSTNLRALKKIVIFCKLLGLDQYPMSSEYEMNKWINNANQIF